MSLQEFVVVDFTDGFEVVGFKTVAWDSVKDYQRACYIADHRPGTTVVQIVLGGWLRIEHDWTHWFERFNSEEHRRIRTAESVRLTKLVAGHKEVRWNLPVLSSKASVVQVFGLRGFHSSTVGPYE